MTSKTPKWAAKLNPNMTTLFIDPGLGGTGLAFFSCLNGSAPWYTTARASGRGDWHLRVMEQTAWYVNALVKLNKPQQVVMEYPKLFAGSASSLASVERGDIGKLTMLCGAISYATYERLWVLPTLVFPDVWKGQLPKAAVLARLQRRWGVLYEDHVGDAAGMGLAAMGLL